MKIFIIIGLLSLSGCALLEPFQDQAADKAAEAVAEYCANTDEAFRADFRASVNAALAEAGHSIEVQCK